MSVLQEALQEAIVSVGVSSFKVADDRTSAVTLVEDASGALADDVEIIVDALDVFKAEFMQKLFALNRVLPPGEDYVASLNQLSEVRSLLHDRAPPPVGITLC